MKTKQHAARYEIQFDINLSLSSGLPCLLATNSPPKTLYTLLSEEAADAHSPVSEVCNDGSFAKEKKESTNQVTAMVYPVIQ